MHSKTLNVLFLSSLAAAAAVEGQVEERQVEERQYGSSGSGDDYYNSLMSDLNSLYVWILENCMHQVYIRISSTNFSTSATNTDYLDYLTAYSDLPTDYSAYLPTATGSGSGSGSGYNEGSNSDSESISIPAMTAAPTVTMPTGMSFDMPPPSIESVLATAIPPSYLSQLANPTAASSIISEIQHGHYPTWYQQLPSSVKAWLTSHYATAGPMATGTAGSSGSGGAPHGNTASTGVLATGFMGAAAILAIAVML